jgi:hypothetical protein
MKMKKAMGFANLYIKGEVYLPIIHNISELINLYNYYYLNKKERQEHYKIQLKEALVELKRNKLTSLSKLKLDPVLEGRIYISLYELTQAILSSTKKPSLISVNREIIQRRKKAIKSFKTALEYPFLTNSVRKAIDGELKRLKQFDNDKDSSTYHPIKELDYHKENEQPTITRGLLGGNISYEFHLRKMEDFLTTPLRVKEGRPPKFFHNVLLIVIFKLLNGEANISIEKAKNLTAEIVNEYCKKQKISEMPNLTSKDIDNALHSSV